MRVAWVTRDAFVKSSSLQDTLFPDMMCPAPSRVDGERASEGRKPRVHHVTPPLPDEHKSPGSGATARATPSSLRQPLPAPSAAADSQACPYPYCVHSRPHRCLSPASLYATSVGGQSVSFSRVMTSPPLTHSSGSRPGYILHPSHIHRHGQMRSTSLQATPPTNPIFVECPGAHPRRHPRMTRSIGTSRSTTSCSTCRSSRTGDR